ncbi:MAG: NAD(P)/FAD-dependent oxidoreductase [Saprospiraceae bacterium]
MNLSYWEQTSFFDKIDIAVIGSGIVGLNAAIHLKEMYPKLRVVIFEKGIIPSGASTRNAGFACFGSITELVDDLETIGLDALLKLVEKRWKGLQKLRQRVGDKHLDYKNWGGYELFSDKKIYEKHCEQMDFFNQALAPIIGNDSVFQVASNQIPTFGFHEVNDLIFNNSEGQINTGKMMQALLKIAKNLDISIFNGISIKNIHTETNGITLETAQNWIIPTKKVIVATNGFSQKLLPNLDLKPARNQVLITQPIPNLHIKGTFHYDSGYYYFRNIGHRLLLGGGRNLAFETETTDNFGLTPTIQNHLTELLKTVILPNTPFEVDKWWSGILGVGVSKEPIIHNVNEHLTVAVRLGGMGVAIGSLVGEAAAKMVTFN